MNEPSPSTRTATAFSMPAARRPIRQISTATDKSTASTWPCCWARGVLARSRAPAPPTSTLRGASTVSIWPCCWRRGDETNENRSHDAGAGLVAGVGSVDEFLDRDQVIGAALLPAGAAVVLFAAGI